MKELIEDFTKHLTAAIDICNSSTLTPFNGKINNVLVCGLGGSGIGGTIISQVTAKDAKCPILINKDYNIPAYVDENTLVLICSYSGNTEESLEMLAAVESQKATIACITSGGKLLEIAKQKNYNHIVIPGGLPPRAAFGLGFPPLFYLLNHYQVITQEYSAQFNNAVATINQNEEHIVTQAQNICDQLFGKIPVIYADSWFEGVAVRFRQQINENAKMLCWHHVIPEMNHNELVGWTKKNDDLAVVLFRNDDDYYRTQKRMDINQTIIKKYTSTFVKIYSKGASRLEKALYLIHFGDWISYLLAEKKGVDVTEVDVITNLKNELAKI